MNDAIRILIVEDDSDWLDIYSEYLRDEKYEIDTARTIQQAFERLDRAIYDVVITDLKMIGFDYDFGGFSVLKRVREISSCTQVIVITAYGTQEIAFRATQQGAFDIVYKPPDPDRLRVSVRGAIQASQMLATRRGDTARLSRHARVPAQNAAENTPGLGLFGITGNSRQMQTTFEKISYAVHTDAPVFLYGETGTGKNLIAKAIHHNSKRQSRPFSSVAFADLVEHWNAIQRNLLRIKGGTFFLDSLQKPGPGASAILEDLFTLLPNVDVRLISTVTTEENTLEKIRIQFGFDANLFERLSQTPIYIPPLRLRKDGDDIPALIGFFIRTITAERSSEPQITFSKEALKKLVDYDYRLGNVRELYDIIHKAVNLLGAEGEITPDQLPATLHQREMIEVKAGPAPASIYTLTVGIDQYFFLNRLRKAAQDAQDFHDLLLQSRVDRQNALMLLDDQATKTNILNALSQLARSVTENDKVIIFFSGHGVQLQDLTKEEYLCPVDTNFADLENTLISSKELTRAFNAIHAGQFICIFDACHAGGVGEIKHAGLAIKDGVSENSYTLLSQGKGRVILASSLPDEVSWEIDTMRNGLFTNFLLEGLRGKAARQNGEVWLSALFGYVSEQIPRHRPQHPYLKSETQDIVILTGATPKDTRHILQPDRDNLSYNLAAVRNLLNRVFSDEGLIHFCHDHFPIVYDDLGSGMSKATKIEYLLDYCERTIEIEKMLKLVQKMNPQQYSFFEDQLRSPTP